MEERKLKVLQLCAVDSTVDVFLLPLVDRLAAEGYDVYIVCSYGSRTERLRERGYKIQSIEISRRILLLAHIASLIRIYRFIRKERFDIVHTYTPIAGVIGRIAARVAGVPVVVFTSLGFYFHENMPCWKRRALILFERLAAKFSDFIFTVSTEDEKTAVEEKITSRNRIMSLNGIGVDTRRFDSREISEETKARCKEQLRICKGGQIIGFIGRSVREKGLRELIEALVVIKRVHPDAKLVIIGYWGGTTERDTRTKMEVLSLIEKHSLDKDVLFTGFVEEMREWLEIVDVFVLPSHREGMPQSILEAMAMGKPVVATDIRGCREEVVDGETGYLVPVQDPQRLAEAIIRVLSDRMLAKRMGEAGRRRVVEFFDQRKTLEKQLGVYRKLVQQRILRHETR
jgi:glycosyltransferase involved in cell wall biosynthesis